MVRVLRRPSWIAFTVLVLVLAVTFVELGRWQWHRHDQRAAFNDLVRASLAAPAVPVDELLGVGSATPVTDEWRQITAVGRYDPANQLLVRNRVFDGQLGFEVITPLVTAAGPALLVDRGWVPVADTASDEPEVPAPPTGTVDVVAHVQAAETGGSGAGGVPAGQVRRVDVADLSSSLPYPLYGAYAALLPGEPGNGIGADPPSALLPPEPSGGPHLAYAIQWWLFTGIALGGWVLLLRAEARPADGAARPARPSRRYLDTGPPDDDLDDDPEDDVSMRFIRSTPTRAADPRPRRAAPDEQAHQPGVPA